MLQAIAYDSGSVKKHITGLTRISFWRRTTLAILDDGITAVARRR